VNSRRFDGLACAVPVSGEADIRWLRQHAELLEGLLANLKPRRYLALAHRLEPEGWHGASLAFGRS